MDYDNRLKVDLHVHTTASDGSLTPAEILKRAEKMKLAAVAITDHDTLEGVRSAQTLAVPSSLKFLAGVEISAQPPTHLHIKGSLHILGYGFDPDDSPLNRALERHQASRKGRNPKIIDRLNRMDLPLTLTDVATEAGGGQMGRAHIAMAMVRKGWVASVDEAFDRYLGWNGPAYVEKFRIAYDETIALINGAGGIATLAHPFLYDIPDDRLLEDLIVELKAAGLKGLEVFYPQHTPERTARAAYWAGRHGLLMTGGSDFHGAINPDIEMGTARGDFFVPYDLYRELAAACRWRDGKESG